MEHGPAANARLALFKGALILFAALFVLGQVLYRLVVPADPISEAIGAIAIVAPAANATCLALLWRHRREDVNMSPVWECSRNDIASNLCAGAGVWLTGSRWPDLIVGAAPAVLLFIASALRVLANAGAALKASEAQVRR